MKTSLCLHLSASVHVIACFQEVQISGQHGQRVHEVHALHATGHIRKRDPFQRLISTIRNKQVQFCGRRDGDATKVQRNIGASPNNHVEAAESAVHVLHGHFHRFLSTKRATNIRKKYHAPSGRITNREWNLEVQKPATISSSLACQTKSAGTHQHQSACSSLSPTYQTTWYPMVPACHRIQFRMPTRE